MPSSHLQVHHTVWGKWCKFNACIGVYSNLYNLQDPVPILQIFYQRVRAGILLDNVQKICNVLCREISLIGGSDIFYSGEHQPQNRRAGTHQPFPPTKLANFPKQQTHSILHLTDSTSPPDPLQHPILCHTSRTMHHLSPRHPFLLLPPPPQKIFLKATTPPTPPYNYLMSPYPLALYDLSMTP